MERRIPPIRKSDLKPAFEAAKAAGYDQVSVVVETADGKRFNITAGSSAARLEIRDTPLEAWRARHAAS